MSNGLNAIFQSQKEVFLRHHVLSVMGFREDEDQPPENATVTDFDLQLIRTRAGAARYVEVIPHARRTKAATWKSKRVTAYWLRWSSRATTTLVLDGAADYFFTSELGGCQVVAEPQAGGRVRVGHIAGDLDQAWRTREAENFPRARRLSSTRSHHDNIPAYQPDNSNIAWANVVGFRHNPWRGPQRWELWYQIVENGREGEFQIQSVGRLYP
jgi:hypothetical protein